jgi:hypothetical protein
MIVGWVLSKSLGFNFAHRVSGFQDLGKICGSGVGQSESSDMSLLYVMMISRKGGVITESKYAGSILGNELYVMFLCENVKGSLLKQVGDGEWTQRDVSGLMVGCLVLYWRKYSTGTWSQSPSRWCHRSHQFCRFRNVSDGSRSIWNRANRCTALDFRLMSRYRIGESSRHLCDRFG